MKRGKTTDDEVQQIESKSGIQTFGYTCNTETNNKSELSVACAHHDLLDSHGSESNILLHRPPACDAVRTEHQPQHVS